MLFCCFDQDVGCGIGGPARHIAAFSGCKVVGLNCNDYQIQRAELLTQKAGLQNQCSFVKVLFNQCCPSAEILLPLSM